MTQAVAAPRPLRRVTATFGRAWWWIVAACLLGAITLAAGIGLLATAGALISRSALVDTTATLALAIVGVRFFAVVRVVARYAERYLGHLGTFRILTRLRVWFFEGIEPLAPAGLVDERSGDLLGRIVDDVDALQDLPLRVVVPPVVAVLAGVTGAVVLGAFEPALGAVLAAFLLVSGLVVPAVGRRTRRAAAEVVVAERAALDAATVEGVGALAELVVHGREDLLAAEVARRADVRRRAERRLARARAAARASTLLLGGLTATATLALGAALVAEGRLDGVLLAAVPLAALATFEAVAPLASLPEHLDRCRAAADRLVSLVDREPDVHEPAVRGQAVAPLPPVPPSAGAITFDGVRFRYGADRPLVLDGASFAVPAGARVAVTGASGSGKSTLVALLLRFWEPTAGSIRLDGVDLADLGSDAARRAVAVVAQHDHLFDTTVRDNLLLADPDADDDRLLAACAAAAFDAVLVGLAGGLDERVGQDGRRLSGGERQRLMIARALLAEAPVLVLDEATAHLDPAAEQRVLAGVHRWRAGRTTVHVVHDPAPLRATAPLDAVLELRAGREA